MNTPLKIAVIELRKKKFSVLLSFSLCTFAMYMIVSSITSATSTAYQKKIFEENLNCDTKKVLHLSCQTNDETEEFADILIKFKDSIASLPGVESVGQFDATGMYFSQLRESRAYCSVNEKIVKEGRYANHCDIVQLVRIDENLLSLMKGTPTQYKKASADHVPIYVSEVFCDAIKTGMLLTDERSAEVYEVVGYIDKGSKWANENDIIRFPLDSLDGKFISAWSKESKKDIMTQLCALHNTYVLLENDANITFLKEQIHSLSLQYGFEASALTLEEEYREYSDETAVFAKRHIALAIFLCAMAVSSIIAVFATNALQKRRQYGIFIANGLSLKDTVFSIAIEISAVVFSSLALAWLIKQTEFLTTKDLFREVLQTAHIRFTLPICFAIGILSVVIATFVPAIIIFRYQPCELIGGNGID